MDRASVGRNRNGQQEQSAHPLALVYSVLLSGGSGQYLRTYIPDVLSKSQASRGHRLDCHSLSDWDGPLEEDAARGRRASATARNSAMDRRRSWIAGTDPWRMDSSLTEAQGA